MRIKPLIVAVLACVLLGSGTGCTTHRKPFNGAGAGVGNPGASPRELYTEGLGQEGNFRGGAESSKCRPGRLIAGAEQHYFFDFDSSEVRNEAMSSIELQANYLVKHPRLKIRLEGNTDDRGSREYNIALGERRARAVLNALRQYGVSSSQVSVISFGAEKPAAGGEDESSYQCNRRVDLIYEK
jgi:peptidoglycan-associated lipoprotein